MDRATWVSPLGRDRSLIASNLSECKRKKNPSMRESPKMRQQSIRRIRSQAPYRWANRTGKSCPGFEPGIS
eukprot:scaffold2383_cov143-Skeletonema_menzelii.AAC.7